MYGIAVDQNLGCLEFGEARDTAPGAKQVGKELLPQFFRFARHVLKHGSAPAVEETDGN